MEKTEPAWLDIKRKIQHNEQIEFVGETGAAGVIDGLLPNGEPYEWSKVNRQHKRRLKKPKG
jgi:hypothetical protein